MAEMITENKIILDLKSWTAFFYLGMPIPSTSLLRGQVSKTAPPWRPQEQKTGPLWTVVYKKPIG